MTAYQSARALIDVGRHAQAESVLRSALVESPDDGDLLTLLAFTLRRQGKPAAALQTCEAALATDPGNAAAHIEHAEVLLALLRNDGALAAAEQAVRLEPHWSASYQILAQVLSLLQRYPQARAAADRALALEPQSVPALVAVANVARLAGDYDDADQKARAALAIDPQNYDARWVFAMLDAERLRTRRSLRMLRGLAGQFPAEPTAMSLTWPIWHLMGTVKRWLGRAAFFTFAVALIGLWWEPAMLPSRIAALVSAVAATGYCLLILLPAGRTPWRCLQFMPPLMGQAAYAGVITAAVQVGLLAAYAATGGWWLALLAAVAAPVLWLLDAAMTIGAGLSDPGGRQALEEVFDGFRQWRVETRRDLRDAWREDRRPKP